MKGRSTKSMPTLWKTESNIWRYWTPFHPQKSKFILIAAAAMLIAALAFFFWWRNRPPKPFATVATLAGGGLKISNGILPDYFGVAVDDDDHIYFSDGTRGSIIRINDDGSLKTITSELDMPSAIAFASDGSLVVANTGAHTIVRVDVESGRVSLIAGMPGVSGDADGVGKLGHEDVVAHLQRVHHRAGGDLRILKDEGAREQRDERGHGRA